MKKRLVAAGMFTALLAPLVGATPAVAAAPANDNFNNPEILATSGSIMRSNIGATAQSNEPASQTGDPYATLWFRWTAATSGRVTFDTFGSDIDTVLAVYTGTAVSSLVEIISNDDGFGCDSTSSVQFDAVAGTTYRIQVGSWDPTSVTDVLPLTWNWARGAQAANDDIATATSISGTQAVNGSTANSTTEPNLPIYEADGEPSVWYKIAAAQPTAVDVSLKTSSATNTFGGLPTVSGEVWAGATPATANLLATVPADSTIPLTGHTATPGSIWIRIVSPSVCEWGSFTLQINSRTGVALTTSFTAFELQQISDASAKLGWTVEQFQHDAVLIWQFIYAIAGITTPTPVATPAPGTQPLTSVFSSPDVAALNSLNAQWVLPSTHTQRVATMVLVFVLSFT